MCHNNLNLLIHSSKKIFLEDNGCSQIHLKEQEYKLTSCPIFSMIIKMGIKNYLDSDMGVLAEWEQQLLHFWLELKMVDSGLQVGSTLI